MVPSPVWLTDRYELTMLAAALADGTAHRRCTFEVFTRRLPAGRRFGVLAGTGRLIEALAGFRFGAADLDELSRAGVVDGPTAAFLADFRFRGDIAGYREGEPYFPHSPVLSVTGTFAEAVLLETLVLSVLNHDSAVAAAAARMVIAAGDRPIIDMGSRRTHEQAAVAAARAAYLVGFQSTSNLEAGRRYAIPTAGTAAHAFTLLHETEQQAFAAQVALAGADTTLLVDTYDIATGIDTAVRTAGTGLGAIRIDSGELAVMAHRSRRQLDDLGATETAIVVSGDLDEFSIAALAAAPVDVYGAGTSVVTGAGAPTAGFVYKLVEVDGRPVEKRSANKGGHGGAKTAFRRHRESGTATDEIIGVGSADAPGGPGIRALSVPWVQAGEPAGVPGLGDVRAHHRNAVRALPWEALRLSPGDPGLPVEFR